MTRNGLKIWNSPSLKVRKNANPILIHHLLISDLALIIYPAVGRRGVNCPSGKRRRGRNELIAEAIQRWTGEVCKRKQVSSHIQVLKLKVQNDSFSTSAQYTFDYRN